MSAKEPLRELEALATALQERGQHDLAARTQEILKALREGRSAKPELPMMTTGEAAQELGVRSVNTIKRWAREGLLEGFCRGGRILVSRSSVERLRSTAALSRQQAFDRNLDDVLRAFDGADDSDPSDSATWQGRKPWEKGARAGA